MGEFFYGKSIVPILVALLLCPYAFAQDGVCRDLPTNSVLEGLMSDTYARSDNPTPPDISIIELNYVCLVSGEFRDTFSTFSVVALYNCTGVQCDPVVQSQYEFTCDDGVWVGTVLGTREFSRTSPADANMTTPNRTDCGLCISPSHPSLPTDPNVLLLYDPITHCFACDPVTCNQGDMRCFGTNDDECCNFYDPNDNDRCLNECPADTRPNDNLECRGALSFSQSTYEFSEADGTGTIQINGTAGLEVRVVGGPDLFMDNVEPSGSDINDMFISPATIIFNITNDDVVVEDNETYLVTMIPSDPNVFVEERMTRIIIIDDDRLQMGFELLNYIRIEGNETGVDVRINGNLIQDVPFNYLRENSPIQPLIAQAGMYVEVDVIMPNIINPDDEIALQDDRVFGLGLQILPPFVDDVELGALIGPDQTFVTSNLTILDDDIVTVSFDQPTYMVMESGSHVITLSLDRGIATAFSVIVRPVPTTQPAGLVPSIPNSTYTVMFPINDLSQSQSFTFVPIDDNIPNEPNEIVSLVFDFISDGRVAEGDSAVIVIIDDDAIGGISFSLPSYIFIENERMGTVRVNGPAIFPAPLSVQITGGPGSQPGAVITSGTVVDQQITSFPADITFRINDDEAALEPDEMYQLTLIPNDPSIIIDQPTADITILDDDKIIIGFNYEEKRFPASAIGDATYRVFGQAQQDFVVNYVQPGLSTPLTFQAQNYTGDIVRMLNINRPSNPLLTTFQIGLQNLSESVLSGGFIGGSEVFPISTIILEPDDIIVGFRDPEYIFSEGGPNVATVFVAKSGDSSSPFTVEVSKLGLSLTRFVVTSAEADNIAGTVNFGAGPLAPDIVPYPLDLTDDDFALENDELLTIALTSNSSNVIIGGNVSGIVYYPTASITIQDNDVVTLRIDGSSSRSVLEGGSTDVCVSKDTQTIRQVNFDLTPEDGTAGEDDYTPRVNQSGTLPFLSVSSDPVCFTFMALTDIVDDNGENFFVMLESTDNFPLPPGRLLVTNDQVEVIIIEPTPDVDVEDTVIGDPLFTVPLPNSQHLCYEIRGAAEEYFNFISDSCVSVNAHYTERTSAGENKELHVIDEIAIRAVDNAGDCIDILVDRNGCTASINRIPFAFSFDISEVYSTNGITVFGRTPRGDGVSISVPNCNDMDLEMEVVCETMNGIDMLRFEVMRGLNLRETSHGLLAQFWNVDVSVEPFEGTLRGSALPDNLVMVTLTPSKSSPRKFPAWLETRTWDRRNTCLYAGNQNGGTVYEVVDDHDTLIEGVYKQYIMESAFSTEFEFSQFNQTCST